MIYTVAPISITIPFIRAFCLKMCTLGRVHRRHLDVALLICSHSAAGTSSGSVTGHKYTVCTPNYRPRMIIGRFQVSVKLDTVQLPRGSFYRAQASTHVIRPTMLFSFVTSLIRFQPSIGHLHTITA